MKFDRQFFRQDKTKCQCLVNSKINYCCQEKKSRLNLVVYADKERYFQIINFLIEIRRQESCLSRTFALARYGLTMRASKNCMGGRPRNKIFLLIEMRQESWAGIPISSQFVGLQRNFVRGKDSYIFQFQEQKFFGIFKKNPLIF